MQGDAELRRFIEDVLHIQQNKFSQLYRVNYWTHDTVKDAPRNYAAPQSAESRMPPSDTDVLLAYMRDETLAAACRQACCFYFHAVKKDGSPTKKVDLTKLKSEYMFPYGPGGKSLGWMARIRSVKLLERRDLIKKLGISAGDLRSECQRYFVVNLKIDDGNPAVDDVSHLISPRERGPHSVKWSDLFIEAANEWLPERVPLHVTGRR